MNLEKHLATLLLYTLLMACGFAFVSFAFEYCEVYKLTELKRRLSLEHPSLLEIGNKNEKFSMP